MDVERFKKEYHARLIMNGIREIDLLLMISHLNHAIQLLVFFQECEPNDFEMAMIEMASKYRDEICERLVRDFAQELSPKKFTDIQLVDEWIHQRLYS